MMIRMGDNIISLDQIRKISKTIIHANSVAIKIELGEDIVLVKFYKSRELRDKTFELLWNIMPNKMIIKTEECDE